MIFGVYAGRLGLKMCGQTQPPEQLIRCYYICSINMNRQNNLAILFNLMVTRE